MGDIVRVPSSDNSYEMQKIKLTKSYLVTPPPSIASKKHFKCLLFPRIEEGHLSSVVFFLVKVAALEIVRRFSRSKCPFLWQFLQSCQLLVYGPFKWLQRWGILKIFAKGIQIFSRPMMLLSIVSAFSDHRQNLKKICNSKEKDDFTSSLTHPTPLEISEMRDADGASSTISDSWQTQLCDELQEEGVIYPERMNALEIHNFQIASNGDYMLFKQSVRKTIQWRESYNILSPQELEKWSHLVFWHGRSVASQPCLIVRLGLAFSSLALSERPSFVQAIVSQVEHGVLHLVNTDDTRIMALVDCDSLAQIKFPTQMMRSCAAIFQDHYPNRLSTLLVTRLSPSTLAIAEAFIQKLKPMTQKKVRIIRETDETFLSNFLQSVPGFLGGSCICNKCNDRPTISQVLVGDSSKSKLNRSMSFGKYDQTRMDTMDISNHSNCEQVLRTVVIGMLILWVIFAILVGMQDLDSFSIP